MRGCHYSKCSPGSLASLFLRINIYRFICRLPYTLGCLPPGKNSAGFPTPSFPFPIQGRGQRGPGEASPSAGLLVPRKSRETMRWSGSLDQLEKTGLGAWGLGDVANRVEWASNRGKGPGPQTERTGAPYRPSSGSLRGRAGLKVAEPCMLATGYRTRLWPVICMHRQVHSWGSSGYTGVTAAL